MCQYWVDQDSKVLNFYSISLVTKFMIAKISQNLNSMKNMSNE